uniref:Uncharacterized protein n=1 Tax=viral metagenome TaxID=1070528 RepID=A0A6C0HEA9_9ZZZZ
MNAPQQKKFKAVLIEDVTADNFTPSQRNNQSKDVMFDYSTPNSVHTLIRQKINNVYDSFVMTKVGQYQDMGIYKALVNSLLAGPSRFIVAIVPNDSTPMGSEKMLSSLRWVSFQTRTTDNIAKEFNGVQVYPQTYSINSQNNISDPVNLIEEKRSHFLYLPENLPIRIEVLKLKEDDSFARKGTVSSALELYQTVLTIEN